MTFFHFGNCVALAYVPYFILYKSSGLSEYSAFWKCIQAGMTYLLTQLCKMLFLATFFPASDVTTVGQFDVFGEFLKTIVDVADLFGLHFIMLRIAGKGQLKFMTAGVGWAAAELVATGFWPLWVGARGIEFDWKYIQMSLDSNISLIQYIATAALIWLYSRKDLNRSSLPIVMFLLASSCYRPLVIEVIRSMVGLGSWMILFIKAMYTSVIGLLSLQIYIGLTVSKDINSNY